MIKATLILFVISCIAIFLTYVNEKFKKIAMFFSFLSMLTFILSIVEFASGYNPLTYIKEQFIVYQEEQNTAPDVDVLEIHLPAHSASTQTEDSTDGLSVAAITTAVFLNIDDEMYRNENGIIHIAWTPIAGQTSYKLKINIDDPFTTSKTNYEYMCDAAQYDFDASDYSENTAFFVSVAIFDHNSSEWFYCEPVSFILK